ncbi:MAG: hypothetical protein QOH69_1590 [Actinomycetota bacterium]|jgi:hypothetical protein|nr:hypothetical protein [Actinomycetota bacterium]
MRKTPVLGAFLAASVLGALVGCTATLLPRATPTAAAHFTPVVFSGTYDSGRSITVPKGAHSATVYVVCSGGGSYNLSGVLNKDLGGLNGGCGPGSQLYQLAVAGGETLDLEIQVSAKDARFVIETRFSASHFAADSELARQCSALVTVGSDIDNAEQGFTLGALSLAQWRQKVSDASAALKPVLSDKPNVLNAQLKTMGDSLGATGVAPGAFVGPSGYASAMSIAGQICSDNGDALYVMGDYGG